MLHLVYRFQPNAKARADLKAFWKWIADRQLWFYDGLEMVLDTKWYTVTIGADVHCLEHHVTFADEAAWGRYRQEVSRRSREPEWEERRTTQDEWYEILDARLLTDPPIPVPLPSAQKSSGAPIRTMATEGTVLGKRSRFLLENARFITLATSGPAGIWASTVNYVVIPDPLRLLWYSLKSARHSINIAAHPYISCSLFLTGLTGTDAPAGLPIDGAQLTGLCNEVSASEAADYHREYYERNFPDPEVREQWLLPLNDFRDAGPRRFYSLQVDDWWLYDADRWLVDKHDTRINVPLSTIHI